MKRWMQSLFIKDIRKAIDQYQMIPPKSRVLVGVSGGKDSAILFYALSLLSRNKIYDFQVTGLLVDHGLLSEMAPFLTFCEKESLNLMVHTEHYAKSLSHEAEFAPCYTCSRMRKGILKRYALEHGYDRIAFGHTQDDIVETFMMNIIQHGKIATMPPVLEDDTSSLKMIRPLIFVKEEAIITSVKQLEIPLMRDICTFSQNRLRSHAESLIQGIELTTPEFSDRVVQALQNIDLKRLL